MTKNNSSHVDQEDQAALGSLPALDPQSDQAISYEHSTESEGVRPGPGPKQQGSGSSNKQQAEKAQATKSQAS